MKDIKALLGKKKGGGMTDTEKEAKMMAVDSLKKQAEGGMGGKLKELKKVSVAAPTTDGLKTGLATAEDLLSSMPEAAEEVEGEEIADEDMTIEDIDAEIERLMALKQSKC